MPLTPVEGHSQQYDPHHARGTHPPAGHASQRDSAGPPRPYSRAHSKWAADPGGLPCGRATGGGRAPDLRRPSQRRKAPHPGTPSRHSHSAPRRLARAHAVGLVLGPHAHTTRTRDRRATGPQGRAAGRGTPPDTRSPSKRWMATPPGQPSTTPAASRLPQGMQDTGTVPGPHARTSAPTASGQRTRTAHPEDGQLWGDESLTSDAPHNRLRQPPPGDALPPLPQRATPARKSARCGAGAGSPLPTPPVPGTHNRPRLPAPRDGRLGEGRPLTPEAPHSGGRPPSPGRPPSTRAAGSPPQGMKAKGTAPAHLRPKRVGSGPQKPAHMAGSRGRTSALPQATLTTAGGHPPGTAHHNP